MGFSFLPENEKVRKVNHVRIESGVNRDFDEAVWDKIKDYDSVKNLLSLGALVVTQEVEVKAEAVSESPAADSLKGVDLKNALSLIEASFDVDQLQSWQDKEQRIRVLNAIAKRITAITEGNGCWLTPRAPNS